MMMIILIGRTQETWEIYGRTKIRFLWVSFFLEVLFKNLICKYIKYTEF